MSAAQTVNTFPGHQQLHLTAHQVSLTLLQSFQATSLEADQPLLSWKTNANRNRMTSPSRPALATINPVEFDCKNGCRAAPLPIALFNCSLLTSGAPREFFSVGSCQLLPPPRHPLQPAVLPAAPANTDTHKTQNKEIN